MSVTPLGAGAPAPPYPAEAWRLFRQAPRSGRLEHGPKVSAEARSAAGKFRLRLEVTIIHGTVNDARFQAYGCPYTIAVGAWLADWCIGRTTAELATAPLPQLRAALEIPEDRAHCWLMAQDVLRDLASRGS
ncbi:MAG: iron-sulfur cluster assembly scaffold protein [Panacagrimonas sp.]